jgi:cytochrome P450 family 628
MALLSDPVILAVCAAILGPLSHILIWIRGDWDGTFYLVLFVLVLFHNLLALYVTLTLHPESLSRWLVSITHINIQLLYVELVYIASTLFSITLYRFIFHPLTKAGIPGPLLSRVTIFHRVYLSLQSNHRHAIVLQTLHQRYGDLVRVGPNHISTLSAGSVDMIHGRGSRCTKGAAYENPMGTCVNWERNPRSHAERRRAWDHALGAEARGRYFGKVAFLTRILIDRLAENPDRDARQIPSEYTHASDPGKEILPVTVNEHIHRFAFDVMGSLCYSLDYGYGSLLHNVTSPIMRVIERYMLTGVYVTMVPWLYSIVGRLWVPDFIATKWDWAFFAFAKNELDYRQKLSQASGHLTRSPSSMYGQQADIMAYLLADQTSSGGSTFRKLTMGELVADVLIMTVGGSDTTNSALVHSLYRLATHRDMQQRIFKELSYFWEDDKELDLSILKHAVYLSAFINEVLRLHPPAASGLPRVVPYGGLTIDGVLIPEGTNLITPTYTLQRDERYFTAADEFLPDRWLDQRHLVKDARAFLPFGLGAYGCPGKQLALMELKIVLASIVKELSISISDSMRAEDLERHVEAGWKDCLTTQPAQLSLHIARRHNV